MITSAIGGLEIIGIRDAGNIDNERLLLRANAPIRPEYYIVVNVKQINATSLIPLNDKVYWFPSGGLVNTNEFIRLYSKGGTYKKEESKYGDEPAIFHDFYWGLDKSIWDGVNSNAVTVLKVNYWNTEKI